jgi:hypothetical protein
MAQQHKDHAETRKLMAGAALAEELGGLDARDPEFHVKAAKLMTQYAEGIDAPVAKVVGMMKKSEFENYRKADADHRDAIFKSVLAKRIEPLMASDAVPFELKNQLVDSQGNFNAAAVERAEALHSGGGGKAGAEFYAGLRKEHGLTKNDLDYLVANPGSDQQAGAVKYIGKDGPVTAEAAKGKENEFRAVGDLPNGGLINIPLVKFNEILNTHKNLNRTGTASAEDIAAQAQEFRDRAVMEATLATVGATPASPTPPGYAEWKSAQPPGTFYKPTPAGEGTTLPTTDYSSGTAPPSALPVDGSGSGGAGSTKMDPLDYLHKALGNTPPSPAPTATPAPSPVAATPLPSYEAWRTSGGTAVGLRPTSPNDAPTTAAVSGLPDDEEEKLRP